MKENGENYDMLEIVMKEENKSSEFEESDEEEYDNIKPKKGKSEFSCDLCDYSNPIKRNLKTHILSQHEGIRFHCDSCDFQAKDKSNLKRHVLTLHEGVRYKCDLCDYKATQQSSLRIHKESTHEGIKHTCEICGFMASRQSNLSAHMKWKHSDEVFYCDQCEFNTKLKCRLTSHYKKSHDCSFLDFVKSPEEKEKSNFKQTTNSPEKDTSEDNKARQGGEIHEEIKDPCFFCEKEFLMSEMSKHIKASHENETKEVGSNINKKETHEKNECSDEDDDMEHNYDINDEEEASDSDRFSMEDEKEFIAMKCEPTLKDESHLNENSNNEPKLEIEEDDEKEEKLVQCDECDYKSPKGWNVRIHKQTVHDGIKYDCKRDDCDFQTTRKYQLKKHLKAVHNEDVRYPCELCETVFDHEFKLRMHIRDDHNNHQKKKSSKKVATDGESSPKAIKKFVTKLRKCYFCDFTCQSPSEMKNHRETSHEGERYTCDNCAFSASLLKNLYAHMRNKHEQKTKSNPKIRSRRKRESTQSESLLCDQCEYQAENSKQMKKHIKTHNNTVQMFCPECPYSTFKKKLLRGHIYIQHTSKDRFLCDECSFTTNTNQGIKRHKERVHCQPRLSPLKPTEMIYCDQCEYSTTINRNLKHHVLVYHMGVRYPCDHCDFQAKDKSNLKRHTLSTHEGVRYSCDQCDYKATQTSSLKLHKESKHEGIKYQCDQCSFMASRQDNLTIHKKIKHSDEVHYCVHCTFRTKVHSRLNTHLKNVHFITNEDN